MKMISEDRLRRLLNSAYERGIKDSKEMPFNLVAMDEMAKEAEQYIESLVEEASLGE